jgi:hypothetical protein
MGFFGQKHILLVFNAFIALVLTVTIVLLIPFDFSKYQIKILNQQKVGYNCLYYFVDLNGDKQVDELQFHWNSGERSMILSQHNGELISQWNLYGISRSKYVACLNDWDHNGFLDAFVFTELHDSIFLNILEPGRDSSENRVLFIDTVGHYHGVSDIGTDIAGILDLNRDGLLDLVFSIHSGWSVYPRTTYSLTLQNGALIKTTGKYQSVQEPIVYSDSNSGEKLICGKYGAYGNGNKSDSLSDHKLWFRAYNSNLNDLFKPIHLGNKPALAQSILISDDDDSTFFIVLVHYPSIDSPPSFLAKISLDGTIIKTAKTELHGNHVVHLSPPNLMCENPYFYLYTDGGNVYQYDFNFEIISFKHITPWIGVLPFLNSDFDGDGIQENIFLSDNGSGAMIYRPDFKYPVKIPFNYPANYYLATQYEDEHGRTITAFQVGDLLLSFIYGLNQTRFLQIGGIALLFSLVYMMIHLLLLTQKKQFMLKKQKQAQMIELQAENISNQFNPHFTFNLLSTLSALIQNAEIDQADYLLVKYAKILRSNLINAQKFETTLELELENIQNFLDIELIKCDNSFQYFIEVDLELYDVVLPKSFVVGFVENALKHGVKRQEIDPILIVAAERSGDKIFIQIKDNGPGTLLPTSHYGGSTHRGFIIADKTIELFKTLTGREVSYQFKPAEDDSPYTYSITTVTIRGQRHERPKPAFMLSN